IERRRRELRADARGLVRDTTAAFAAGRVPSAVWTIERVRELQRREELVAQRHKPPPRDDAWEGEE
ncbi:MAG TPA: hypothetical protein VLS46_07875, partial [Gaiellaceae bacterium]|nr:hypothetical protein [Gaiellaceae bacterium]